MNESAGVVPPLQDGWREVQQPGAHRVRHWRAHRAWLAAFHHTVVHRVATAKARRPHLVKRNVVPVAVNNRLLGVANDTQCQQNTMMSSDRDCAPSASTAVVAKAWQKKVGDGNTCQGSP